MAEDKKTKAPAPDAIDPDSTITINTGEGITPRREGTAVHAIFKVYKNGMKVGAFLEKSKDLGGAMSHVRKDMKAGRITVTAPKKAA